MAEEDPCIYIILPGVENFAGAVAAVRATGAKPVPRQQRTFVLDEPRTIAQVDALLDLTHWRDSGTEGEGFWINVEPKPERSDSY